jgi:hypothetical protein
MKWWAIASGLVLTVTAAAIATIYASPDWLPYFCSADGDSVGCSSFSPLLAGFIGVLVSVVLLIIGSMRSEP